MVRKWFDRTRSGWLEKSWTRSGQASAGVEFSVRKHSSRIRACFPAWVKVRMKTFSTRRSLHVHARTARHPSIHPSIDYLPLVIHTSRSPSHCWLTGLIVRRWRKSGGAQECMDLGGGGGGLLLLLWRVAWTEPSVGIGAMAEGVSLSPPPPVVWMEGAP